MLKLWFIQRLKTWPSGPGLR